MYRLSCRAKNDMWFDLVGIVLYFVTSSDSGSLVIDCLSTNGDPKPPVLQYTFWALTEGATATALLYVGGNEALTALQTVSIASGVPYTILLCFMCGALWRALKIEAGDLDVNGPQFTTNLLDVLSTPTTDSVVKVFLSIMAPWYFMGVAAGKVERPNGRTWTHMLILAIPFYAWITLLAMGLFVSGIGYVGWCVLFGFFAYATGIRNSIREKHGINGSMVEDFFEASILYPFTAYQMEHHMKNYRPRTTGEDHSFKNGTTGHCHYGKSESCCIPLGEVEKLLCDQNERNTNV